MFAVAQKKHVFIYDSTGVQLHCLKQYIQPLHLDFLYYHFLLVSTSKAGFLKYHDTSTGQLVCEHKTKLGRPSIMKQNPSNAVIGIGHNNGQVTMWTPNMNTPVVSMYTHRAPVSNIGFYNNQYMMSAGKDGRLKIWDIRMYRRQPLQDYFLRRSTSKIGLDVSQTGLMAVGCGNQILVWKDAFRVKRKEPYMKHTVKDGSVQDVKFVPFEDFLGIGHSSGFDSITIPGSGQANFDSFVANVFESKKQRQEREVHQLLDKIQPDAIVLNPESVGMIDKASKEVLLQERKQQIQEQVDRASKLKQTKKKMKKTMKSAQRETLARLKLRQKMVQKAQKRYQKKAQEEKQLEDELGILMKLDKSKKNEFQPFKSIIDEKLKK